MDFGRRSAPAPEPAGDRSADSSGGRLDSSITIAALAILAVAAGLIASQLYGGQAPERDVLAAGADLPPVAAACTGRKKVAHPGELDFSFGDVVRSAPWPHPYFKCISRRSWDQLCHPAEKVLIVRMLLRHLREVNGQQRQHDAIFRSAGGKAIRNAIASQQAENGIVSQPPRPEPSPLVVGLMRDLVSQGVLEPGDFGEEPPEYVKAHIGDVPRHATLCRS